MYMKKATLFFLFISLPFFVTVRADDSLSKDSDWRFAAGVTLYSNNEYTGFIELEHRPLEVNLRYRVGTRHTFRMGLPLSLNVNMEAPNYPKSYNDEMSLEDYYKWMSAYSTAQHFTMYENNYSLAGISLGYDYSFSLTNQFSAFAGVDLAYYYLGAHVEYFQASYSQSSEEKTSELDLLEYVKFTNKVNSIAVKPFVGLRYHYQKLILEASLDYLFNAYKYSTTRDINRFLPIFNTPYHELYQAIQPKNAFEQLVYQFSVYYTF